MTTQGSWNPTENFEKFSKSSQIFHIHEKFKKRSKSSQIYELCSQSGNTDMIWPNVHLSPCYKVKMGTYFITMPQYREHRAGPLHWVFCATHILLRMWLPYWQPVNCILWPIGLTIWQRAASKLIKYTAANCTAKWPYCCIFLYCGYADQKETGKNLYKHYWVLYNK